MKCDTLITIIVPVYNVEKYLAACISSVQRQTYNNFELILIDDGSTDLSGHICEDFASKDSRIVVFHQNNSGLSAARNKGIDNARGEYISFVDSDDYIAPDYIEKLYIALKKENVQISICDYKKVSEDIELDELGYEGGISYSRMLLSNEEAIRNVYGNEMHGVDFISVAKLYDINIFKNRNIRFPVGRIHEDSFTTYKLLYETPTIVYIDVPLYFYRIREGSITTSTFSMKKLDKLIATREECEFFRNNKNYELLRLAFFDHIHENKMILKSMSEASGGFKIEMNEVSSKLREDIKKYSQYIDIPLKKKIYYTLLSHFPCRFILKL